MRRHDWASRLHAVVEAHYRLPFEWGKADCCLFAARCVDAMTDREVESQILDYYTDEASAHQFIASFGDLQTTVSQVVGPVSSGRATRGDVVLVDGGQGDALGICMGGVVLVMTSAGIGEMPRSAVKAVWKIA